MRSILIALLFISVFAKAQVTDNFSDGDFTANPVWSGDDSVYTIVANQLRSNKTMINSTFCLSTPSTLATNCQWEFWVNLKFGTSSTNYVDIYLTSDQADLKATNINGYFVRIGDTSDKIALYKRSGAASSSVVIIDGTPGSISSSSNNIIKVKVTRDASNVFTLSREFTTGTLTGNYTTEGTVTDASFTTSAFLGISIKQSTASFFQKHYFDDFYVGPIVLDVTPPTIISSTIISSTQLDVLFSESVDLTTSQTLTNYSANNSLGNPSVALRDVVDFSLVHLTFASTFTPATTNTLTISNVKDLSGNLILTGSTTNFSYYLVQPFDVVINEIMADPSPVVGLPDAEWVELFNRTAFPIDLTNWTITVGTTVKVFPAITIQADSFLVLTATAAIPNFASTIATVGFSSMSLTNSGQIVTLKTPQGATVSTVTYSDTWYQDANKKNGGWSLEQIDPNNPCAGMNNWRAAFNSLGGTPGTLNSRNGNNPDNSPPQVLRVAVIATDTIQVYFNEPLDSTTMLNLAIYSIDNSIGFPSQLTPIAPDFKSVRLALSSNIAAGIIYTITINNAITDCVGNAVGLDNTALFALPEPALPDDIVINEILFDPQTDGVDFVEIYNRSNKVIDLKTMTLSQYDTVNNVLMSISTISDESYLIFPQQYLVLSENGATVKSQYYTTNPKGFLDMSNLPTMNISGGTVCLATNAYIIDLLKYYDNMQFPLLNITKGVSLERIDFNRPTQDVTNWHSAAQDIGFATPAYKNSQYNDAGETDNAIEITPEIFSPDEDGINDIVNINYHFDAGGFVANITIYDSKGRIVRNLVRNELLGLKGTYSWDGINSEREKARIGIYVIFVEVFDLSGRVKQYKKTCVLGAKL